MGGLGGEGGRPKWKQDLLVVDPDAEQQVCGGGRRTGRRAAGGDTLLCFLSPCKANVLYTVHPLSPPHTSSIIVLRDRRLPRTRPLPGPAAAAAGRHRGGGERLCGRPVLLRCGGRRQEGPRVPPAVHRDRQGLRAAPPHTSAAGVCETKVLTECSNVWVCFDATLSQAACNPFPPSPPSGLP